MTFEDRLSRTLASVLGLALAGAPLAGCGGGGGTDTDTGGDTDTGVDTGTPPGLEAVCDGATPPEHYRLAEGWVTVEPGEPCPDAADAQLQVHGCTFLEWQDITCGFLRVDHDQVFVDDGYGGYWASVTSAGTGAYVGTDVVDVCYYEGVFWRDPEAPTCGRPLLREGEAVVAGVRSGPSGWSAAAQPVLAGLTAEERDALAAHWLESARMEHASVASFSHFALDLMRLGAPPELLDGAHRAALDEIEHARLCFALACGYRGAPVGPGALDAPAPSAAGLFEVAEALVREGCVGETLAAVDAAARLAGARDPAVRAALEVIVRDESAHAALAWRTLRWMLASDDGALRAHLEQVFAEERERWTALPDAVEPVSAAAAAHGLIDRAARARQLRRAWDEVVAPSWAALA